jgi:hypothetical protein
MIPPLGIRPSNVGNFYLTFFADSEHRNDCQHRHAVKFPKGRDKFAGVNHRSFQVALRVIARWASASAACHSGNA